MGMFDVVVFDRDFPGFPLQGRRFQTKDLDCCLDLYTVTQAGRLCLTGNDLMRHKSAAAGEVKEVDIDFHGDIRLLAEDNYDEYVARFTHGTLEWIRTFADQQTSNRRGGGS